MWLLFLLFSFQDKPFYELYKSGSEKLEARDYRGAITDLEAAIEERKESSPTAKTYGVRFISYFPYHKLAIAYFSLKDSEKARYYLDLAYQYEEDKTQDNAVTIRMKMIEEMVANYGAEPPNPDNPDTTPVEDKPDFFNEFLPIFDHIVQNDFDRAAQEIEKLKLADPDNPIISSLEELNEASRDMKTKQDMLETSQVALMDKIQQLWEAGKEAETTGDYETAYHNYLAVKQLDPSNFEATDAVARVRKELEDRGKSEDELQDAFGTAQQAIAQLIEDKATLEKNQTMMARENRDLLNRLKDFQDTKSAKGDVEVKWGIEKFRNRTANVRLKVISSVPLTRATLFLNDKQIRYWDIDKRTEFQVPMVNNLKFVSYENEFAMRVMDDQGHKYTRYQRVDYERPIPLFTRRVKQSLILISAALILAIFGMRQLKKRKAFRERFNPYIAGAPILNEKMFYGRDTLLKQILNTLHNNSLMIYGERRIGKTSFLHRLNNALPFTDDPQYQFIPVFIDLQGVKEEHFFASLDHEIGAVLETHNITLEAPPEIMDHRKFTSRLRKYINALKQQCEKKPKLVLLLDEVDVMNGFSEQTNQQLRSVFMKGFAEHIVAVMAGIHINTRWKSEGSPWYNFFEQIGLKPFSKSHADALITKPVTGVYQYSPDAVKRIMELTDGKPYLIQKMCLNLVSHILAENRRRILPEDVDYVFNEIKREFYGAQE